MLRVLIYLIFRSASTLGRLDVIDTGKLFDLWRACPLQLFISRHILLLTTMMMPRDP